MKQRVSQHQRDENEFLSDLDKLRSKWTMRSQPEYSAAVKTIISEFTNPANELDAYPQPVQNRDNIV